MKLFTGIEQLDQLLLVNTAELERGDRVVINTFSGSGYIYEAGGIDGSDLALEGDNVVGSLYRANYDKSVTRDTIKTSFEWAQVTNEGKFALVKTLAPLEVGKRAVFLCDNDERPTWRTSPIITLNLVKAGADLDTDKLIFERYSLKNSFLRRFKLRQS